MFEVYINSIHIVTFFEKQDAIDFINGSRILPEFFKIVNT